MSVSKSFYLGHKRVRSTPGIPGLSKHFILHIEASHAQNPQRLLALPLQVAACMCSPERHHQIRFPRLPRLSVIHVPAMTSSNSLAHFKSNSAPSLAFALTGVQTAYSSSSAHTHTLTHSHTRAAWWPSKPSPQRRPPSPRASASKVKLERRTIQEAPEWSRR